MIEIKLHKGRSKIYPVSKEIYTEVTKEKYPYVQNGKNAKEAFAICPLCENPVKLLGIYAKLEKQIPHARYYKSDVSDLADFFEYKYKNCPYHKQNADYILEVRNKKDMTERNREVLRLARDYFGICIRIIQKTTGLIISQRLAKEIAYDYMAHPGYLTYDITTENVPYIMGMCMTGKSLMKRLIIKDSPLYQMLINKKEIRLVELPNEKNYPHPLCRIESNVGFLDIKFNISRYRYSVAPSTGLTEYLTLHIGMGDGLGTYKDFAKKEIPINPFLFSKLIDQHEEEIGEEIGEDLGLLGMEEDLWSRVFLYRDKFPI